MQKLRIFSMFFLFSVDMILLTPFVTNTQTFPNRITIIGVRTNLETLFLLSIEMELMFNHIALTKISIRCAVFALLLEQTHSQ